MPAHEPSTRQHATHAEPIHRPQIWRKRQGLEWYPSEPQGMQVNVAHLTMGEVKPNPKPLFPTDLTLAYGRGAAVKLVRYIEDAGSDAVGSNKSILRLKAMEQSMELMHGQDFTSLVAAGIVPALNETATKDADEKNRVAALVALCRLARERTGRESMLENDSCAALCGACKDSVAAVRKECLATIGHFANYDEGRKALVEKNFVELLLVHCRDPPDGGPPESEIKEIKETQCLALTALGRICQGEGGRAEAIRANAVPTVLEMLHAESVEAQYQAAMALSLLTFDQAEKAECLGGGVMRKLAVMLRSDKVQDDMERRRLRTAAAALLMSMCNGTRNESLPPPHAACKAEAIEKGICQSLVSIVAEVVLLHMAGELDDRNSELGVYAAKSMTELADSPKGRKLLKAALGDLKVLAGSQVPTLCKNVQIAIERIEFVP